MLSPLLLLGAAAFLITGHLVIQRILFARRAAALGCGKAPMYKHKDPILGLDLAFTTFRAIANNTLLDLFTSIFEEYGNTYAVNTLGQTTIMTNESENFKAILTRIEDWPIAGLRLYATLPVLGPKSVFSSNGQLWHSARALIRPSFVRDQVTDLKCFDRHISNLLAVLPRDGSTFDLQMYIVAMTMDSSTDFMMGYSTNSLVEPAPEAQQFLRDFEYAAIEGAKIAILGSILNYIPHRKLQAAVQRMRAYLRSHLKAIIAAKKKSEEINGDRSYVFLDEVLKAMSDEEYVVDQMLSILVAGRDTTAAAMTAAFYFLTRDPKAVEKLRTEIKDLGVKNPSWDQLKGMKYLNNVVKEALRLFPPVAVNSREASKEVVLPVGGGPDGKQPILVAKGTSVRYSTWHLQRRKDTYGPDADEFRPERWDNLRVGWEYTPFSGGPRICIGQQFALTQIAYTLYKFFNTFKAIEPREFRPLEAAQALTISFANGCMVGLTPE
ncbi:cytochrome P450 [Podospora appendiculata]|uniref:Cytochrome P450 n=1 Tax=Podospora appendiculata TaxID=314037 RepID=A0AAE0XL94_9PEZI|nr:cytochrome P450 [Podospora appendiculata]